MKLVSFKEQAFQETPIGRLPEAWRTLRIGELADINSRSTNPRKELVDSEFWYIDIDSVEGESGTIKTPKRMLGKDAPSRARRIVLENDVIMSTVRPYLKAFALIPKEYDHQICSTGFAVLTSKEEIMPHYLLSTLFSDIVISQCNRMMVGGQYPAINNSQVSNILIPLPPIWEQQGISKILTVVDLSIQKTQDIIIKTEYVKKALMNEFLTHGIGHKEFKDTEIGRIPLDWQVISLADVFNLTSGKPRPENISPRADSEMPYAVYGGNGIMGYASQFLLDRETVVIGRVGEYCGAAYKTSRFSWITDNALYATEFTAELDLDFLLYLLKFLNLNRFKKKMGQPLLTQRIVYRIRIPYPPSPEQRHISSIFATVDKQLELEKSEKAKLEKIKQGLMDLLLNGKVRVRRDYDALQ